ncbi:MAG: hypothetical protein VB144_09660 [Clostridia bacterium]|nr:hypothetical protein [Clostridia bacterium]
MMRNGKLITAAIAATLALLVFAGACSAQVGAMSGNSVGWVFLKTDELNGQLTDHGFAEMPKGMFIWGGYGIGDIPGGKWSIGGWGAGGNAKSVSGSGASAKTATLALSMGGIMAQYNISVSEKVRFGLGAVLGGGAATLTATSGQVGGFEDLLGPGHSSSAWRPYLLAQPQASLAFPVSQMIDARISGGYTFMYAPVGWIEGSRFREHFQGPLKTIGVPFIELGISFGGPMGASD